MTRAGLFLSALLLVVALTLIAADACGMDRDPRNDAPDVTALWRAR